MCAQRDPRGGIATFGANVYICAQNRYEKHNQAAYAKCVTGVFPNTKKMQMSPKTARQQNSGVPGATDYYRETKCRRRREFWLWMTSLSSAMPSR